MATTTSTMARRTIFLVLRFPSLLRLASLVVESAMGT